MFKNKSTLNWLYAISLWILMSPSGLEARDEVVFEGAVWKIEEVFLYSQESTELSNRPSYRVTTQVARARYKSAQEAFSHAIDFAQRERFAEVKKVLYHDPADGLVHSRRALVVKTFEWSVDDGRIWDSSGKVSRFTDESTYRTGDQRKFPNQKRYESLAESVFKNNDYVRIHSKRPPASESEDKGSARSESLTAGVSKTVRLYRVAQWVCDGSEASDCSWVPRAHFFDDREARALLKLIKESSEEEKRVLPIEADLARVTVTGNYELLGKIFYTMAEYE